MGKFIRAEGATYRYKDGFSLDTINLDIYEDDITFIVGDNGSGKSTLSKLLCGIIKPNLGNLWINDLNSKLLSLSDIGKSIGYLWQNVDLQLFCINVWDELIFKYNIENRLTEEAILKAEELMKTLKIYHLKDKNILNISKGEKQRLAIATMLLNDNSFFILDEPTTGLDSECKDVLKSIIKSMNKDGCGFIIISHDEEFTNSLADRIIHIDKGGIDDDKRIYC